MIIHRCDICKKNVAHLETIVLYKKSFDYCINCKTEAERIKEKFNKEYEYEYAILSSRLKGKENKYLSEIKEETNE